MTEGAKSKAKGKRIWLPGPRSNAKGKGKDEWVADAQTRSEFEAWDMIADAENAKLELEIEIAKMRKSEAEAQAEHVKFELAYETRKMRKSKSKGVKRRRAEDEGASSGSRLLL